MDGRIRHFFVVLLHLEIRKDRVASIRVRHNSSAPVNQSLFVQFLEHIPNRLHKIDIHSLIIPLKIYPPRKPIHNPLPLLRIPHHDIPTMPIVLLNPHLVHFLLVLDLKLLIYLVLHRQPVTIPPEPPRNVVPCLTRVPAHHVLDGSGCDVAVVRSPRRERRTVVESVGRKVFGLLELLLECLGLGPVV